MDGRWEDVCFFFVSGRLGFMSVKTRVERLAGRINSGDNACVSVFYLEGMRVK